jgi:hypothetical protein
MSGLTTIYYTPYLNGMIHTYDAGVWTPHITAEILLGLSGLSPNKNYDVFAFWSGLTVTLDLSAAWLTDNARADALARQDGILVKAADSSRRYVGTFRARTSTRTDDTENIRGLWNYYNRVDKALRHVSTDSSWIYSTATYRQANANAANKFSFVTGDEQLVYAAVKTITNATSSGWGCSVGIGIDSTTVNSAQVYGAITNIPTTYSPTECLYEGIPSVGYHQFNWLEISGGIAVTFYGNLSNIPFFQWGMTGRIGC